MDKKAFSERDICTKFITPALKRAGWNEMTQIREEVGFTKGRIILRGMLVSRGKAKRADYILYFKPNIPLALVEAKDNTRSVGDGMQQGLEYATTLDISFVFSSNGDGIVFHDRTGAGASTEATLGLDAFPSPIDLWVRYCTWKGLDAKAFYGIIALAFALGLLILFLPIDPIKALFWSVVLNGLIAVPLMVATMVVVSNRKHLVPFVAPIGLRIMGWLATAVMAAVALAMFVL